MSQTPESMKMDDHEHSELDWDPQDDTKVWPEGRCPTSAICRRAKTPTSILRPRYATACAKPGRRAGNPPEITGRLTRSVLERCNDYLQPRACYGIMIEWERDELVKMMGELLAQCERDVQERMVWHLLLVYDDYGSRASGMIGVGAKEVCHLKPLPRQIPTEQDRQRLQNLGNNGDQIKPKAWGPWTSSVESGCVSVEQVLTPGGSKQFFLRAPYLKR